MACHVGAHNFGDGDQISLHVGSRVVLPIAPGCSSSSGIGGRGTLCLVVAVGVADLVRGAAELTGPSARVGAVAAAREEGVPCKALQVLRVCGNGGGGGGKEEGEQMQQWPRRLGKVEAHVERVDASWARNAVLEGDERLECDYFLLLGKVGAGGAGWNSLCTPQLAV